MSVAAHLGINLAEYDARIRTFIPNYEEMLEAAADVLDPKTTTIVDLGTGTGAFAERCLRRASRARIIGIDADPEILKAAADRLPNTSKFLCGNFAELSIPGCDAIIASFALHHVRTPEEKASLYGRMAAALSNGGTLVNVDCQPARDAAMATRQMNRWKDHLLLSYSDYEAEQYLATWSQEDVYVPLADESALMQQAELSVEVVWRKDAFTILVGKK
ncbi:MAG TPA: class I SAM-dependent methyltransferase [Terriglobales bacterium]|nr:class I SAM-dependent methyltransferase [Terriglobales bacterium]